MPRFAVVENESPQVLLPPAGTAMVAANEGIDAPTVEPNKLRLLDAVMSYPLLAVVRATAPVPPCE